MSAELWVHTNIIKLLASHLRQLIFKQEELDLVDFWHQHPFSKLEAILLALGVAKAVVAIHSKNFMHRDIKDFTAAQPSPLARQAFTFKGALCCVPPPTMHCFYLNFVCVHGGTCGCHLLSLCV